MALGEIDQSVFLDALASLELVTDNFSVRYWINGLTRHTDKQTNRPRVLQDNRTAGQQDNRKTGKKDKKAKRVQTPEIPTEWKSDNASNQLTGVGA